MKRSLMIGFGLCALAAVAVVAAVAVSPVAVAAAAHAVDTHVALKDIFTAENILAMGVVTKYGRSYKDPAAIYNPEAVLAEGRVRMIQTGAIAVANGDSATSKFYLGKIPSNAVPLHGLSTLKHGAITGLSDADIGLEKDGTTVEVDIFADGLTLASAGAKDPFASIAVADVGKRIWELLGLPTDPGCEYDIVLTMNADASAAASFAAQILYAKK